MWRSPVLGGTDMAIVFDCPHCKEPYRLKDEFAGRKATCKNVNCRQLITIPTPLSAAEAEAAAHSALVEEAPKPQEAETPAEKTIPVMCSYCGHNWTEPWSKAGKNTLCPECRQRIRVPEPKEDTPEDWRQKKTKLPSLAKQAHEKLEGVQDAADVKNVSGEALRGADATGEEYEPIPLKRKLMFAGIIAAIAGSLIFGVYYLVTRNTTVKDDQLMADAWKEYGETSRELAPGEAALGGALLRIADAEYCLRQNNDKKLKEAHERYVQAINELRKAPISPTRHAVAAELASRVIAFGGTDDEVRAQIRLPWRPETQATKLGSSQRAHTIHEEIQKPLGQFLAGADFDFKIAVARRLTRELVKKGQAELAMDMLPLVLFPNDAEKDEARAVIALEIKRADPGSSLPQQVAESLKKRMEPDKSKKPPTWNPYPASAQTLFSAVGMEFRPVPPPQASGSFSEVQRIAYTGKLLMDNQLDQAVELARRGTRGDAPAQIKALVLCAEWMPDPGPALDAALAIINAKERPSLSHYLLLRLAQLGFEKGKHPQANEIAGKIPDEGLKAWAFGDGARLRTLANPKEKADEGWYEVPNLPEKLRAGHAWGRLWIARQNALLSGDRSAEKKVVSGWQPAPLRPFGLAGIALGLQDR